MDPWRKQLSVRFTAIRRLENEKDESFLPEINEIRDEVMELAAQFNEEAARILAE